MTAIQVGNVLRDFGADVLLLALGVTCLTSLLKKTVFKRATAKLYVFLPFLIGIVLYAVFRMAATWSVLPLTQELRQTLEGGFSCGSAATLYYAVYEQFLRKGSLPSVLHFLDGFLPDSSENGETDDPSSPQEENESGAREISPVSPLLKGIVPEENRARAAEEIAAVRGCEDAPTRISDILLRHGTTLEGAELLVASELIARYLDALG